MPNILSARVSVRVARQLDVLRRPFADVEHHARNHVQRGVEFTPLAAVGNECRFRKTVHVLGIPFVDEVVLKRKTVDAITEESVSGRDAGVRLTSRFRAVGSEVTRVEATVEPPLRGLRKLALPLVRSLLLARLARALEEDRRDLEEGGYGIAP